MSWYRRNRTAGGTYFFTVVSYRRRRLFDSPMARACLRNALRDVRRRWPFEIEAIVLLPDHLHSVWRLPTGDDNYSLRWQKVKEAFTRSYLASGGSEGPASASRRAHHERAVWQRRFWEHTCRDEDDLKRCIDYVHWNPVKHRLVRRVADYPWSSFHRYVSLGEYSLDWGGIDPCPDFQPPE